MPRESKMDSEKQVFCHIPIFLKDTIEGGKRSSTEERNGGTFE